MEPVKTNAEKFLDVCQEWLGKPVPKGNIPKEYGCAATVAYLIHQVLPDFPTVKEMPEIADTRVLLKELKKRSELKADLTPQAGSLIVTPRVGEKSGHTGNFLTPTLIASNNSLTGIYEQNYTWPNGWMNYFGPKGRGLPHTIIFNWK